MFESLLLLGIGSLYWWLLVLCWEWWLVCDDELGLRARERLLISSLGLQQTWDLRFSSFPKDIAVSDEDSPDGSCQPQSNRHGAVA